MRSSIAVRASQAESSRHDYGKFWKIVAVVIITNAIVYVSSYVVLEYGLFRDTSAHSGSSTEEMLKDFEYQRDGFGNDADEHKLGVTGSFFTSNISDENYMLFFGFVLWGTVVLTGLGIEFFTFLLLMKGPWDQATENRWLFAQFLFPLLASTCFGMAHSHNSWALPLVTITLHKFGFPETILYLYSGLFDKSNNASRRLIDMLEGFGIVIHHSSSALYITMLLVRIIPSTRSTIEVVVPLLVQHWFVLLRYRYRYAYIVVEMVLEVWFEWTILSLLEMLHKDHWVAGVIAIVMLFAHWLYFISGVLSFCTNVSSTTTSSKDPSLQRLATVRDLNAFGALDMDEEELYQSTIS